MQGSEHLIVLDQVAAEINRRLPDAAAFNEGNHGGVCCVYARESHWDAFEAAPVS